MFSISFISPTQAQPNSLDDCASHTNAFWSLTYQDTEELHDSNSVRVCAVVDGELGNIPRIDRISSNNDLISLSVELREGYQMTFFSETNFGGERLVFTDSRTETNPFEVFSYIVEPLQAVLPAQTQRGPNSLDDCANNTNAFWSLTYQDTEELHDSNSMRVCAVVDGELGNIPRVDRISSNNDLISLSVELRTGYQVTFFSEINFGGERLVFTDSRTETNPFEVFSYIVEQLPEVVEPEVVEPLDLVSTSRKVIVAGLDHTCALRADRRVVCWGDNEDGQTNVPASVKGETVQIEADAWHTCTLQSDSTVVCWGGNYNDVGQTDVPASVQGEVVQIAVGSYYTCAVQADRRVVCWGNNLYGQTTVPASVQGEVVQIAAGWYHTCALRADRTVMCWKKNKYTSVPASVQGETVQIAAGLSYTCAVLADRRVVCWGKNDDGQATVPASVQGETVQITAGWHHTCAMQADRTVVCWGDNRYGQATVPEGLRVAH